MTGDAGIVATPRAHEATAPSLEQQHPSLNLKLSAAAPTSAGSPNTAHVAHATAETASQAQHQHRHGGLRRVHLVPTDLSKTIYRTHQSLFEDIVFDEGGLGSARTFGILGRGKAMPCQYRPQCMTCDARWRATCTVAVWCCLQLAGRSTATAGTVTGLSPSSCKLHAAIGRQLLMHCCTGATVC